MILLPNCQKKKKATHEVWSAQVQAILTTHGRVNPILFQAVQSQQQAISWVSSSSYLFMKWLLRPITCEGLAGHQDKAQCLPLRLVWLTVVSLVFRKWLRVGCACLSDSVAGLFSQKTAIWTSSDLSSRVFHFFFVCLFFVSLFSTQALRSYWKNISPIISPKELLWL